MNKGKKEQISTPYWIINNDDLMTSFIKGLVDTDFSLKLINKPSNISIYYPIISLKLKSKILVKEVGYFLKKNKYKIRFDYTFNQRRNQKDHAG